METFFGFTVLPGIAVGQRKGDCHQLAFPLRRNNDVGRPGAGISQCQQGRHKNTTHLHLRYRIGLLLGLVQALEPAERQLSSDHLQCLMNACVQRRVEFSVRRNPTH